MVHWSRFASSVWDSLLSAHVSAETAAERMATFDAAVTDFFDNTFPNMTRDSVSQHGLQYIKMSFDILRFMARRATAMSLQFDHTTAHLCGELAMDTLSHVQMFETSSDYPLASALRIHTIPSLASSLLLLCCLLISELDELDLSLENWIPCIQQTFDTLVNLLNDRAQVIPLAWRVLKDFEKIIPVIHAGLSRWSTETLLLQGSPDWSVVRDVIPPDAAKLLPYREQIPDIRYPMLYNEMDANSRGYMDAGNGFCPWNTGSEPGDVRSSVLWI